MRTPMRRQKAGEKMTDKMVGAIDKDMQEARNKLKQLNALQKRPASSLLT